MPSSESSTRTQSRHDRPRIAVTGYFAHYEKERNQSFGLRHRFRSADGPSLRDAFQKDVSEQFYVGSQGAPAHLLSLGSGWQNVGHELRHIGLWTGARLRPGIHLMGGTVAGDPTRVAVVFSSSKNRLVFRGKGNPDVLGASSDHSGNVIAQKIGARGPRLSPVAACATGAHAMAIGAQLIQDGYADVAICGAIEPVLTPLVLAAYDNMGALSKNGVMRPFDTKRDGFVPNVGAGCLILENEEKARQRGATIHGYLSGWAMNADATHMTAMCPSGDSIARAIEYSMRRADVSSIDYINAHGTATKLNDETEVRGIRLALGNKVAVSSTKPMTGHLLGAAGAVEAVISLLALRENFAPPTLNLEDIDNECDLDLVVGKGREIEMQSVLSLNYGFGGHIGALLFEKA